MSKPPPIPPEQRAFKGQKPDIEGRRVEGPKEAGTADLNLDEQGRHGNLRQNTTHSGNVQDR